MWVIWANQLLPQTLKSCPKSNKSPNLVTLDRCSNSERTLHTKVGKNALKGGNLFYKTFKKWANPFVFFVYFSPFLIAIGNLPIVITVSISKI